QQRSAFSFLALTRHRVAAFPGPAGVGKSVVAGRLSKLGIAKGYQVRALAPTLEAVETLRKEGLAAETVQSFLLSRTPPPGQPEFWMVDEAGMLGARDLRDLLQKAEEQNARVVLAGDVHQFGSVPAGRSSAQLLEGGLPSAELTQIVRQQRAPDAV